MNISQVVDQRYFERFCSDELFVNLLFHFAYLFIVTVQIVILLACISNWLFCLFYYSDSDGLISYDSIFAPLLISVIM
uniref:Uncharacterized protein n=1 Tax=Romanomermis culicivorax TaxID=13658 RepID=A0A915HL90_ROMCU